MLVHLKTLGCRLNEAELESWAQDFQKAGHQITCSSQDADIVVLNTCAVTHQAVRKSRQSLRRIHHLNPRAKLVVSGCYVTLQAEEAQQAMGVDLVISNKDKHRLVDIASNELNLQSMPAMSTEPGEIALFSRGRQRAFIKVQDGCRYRCTFCIVTTARGDEISRPVHIIIDEINTLYQQGINEVILTGVHLGGYGDDIDSNLCELITTILAATDIPRLRLGSLEPWELPADFFNLFANPRLMPHLHLPLQSGSDSVLRRMARRCKSQEFAQLVEQARSRIANLNLTTDIIVGFPGETDQEWQESYEFIQRIGFGHLHIFTYSPREGTKAAGFSGQVQNHIKKQRSRQLHQLAEAMKRSFQEDNLGKTYPVLWEGDTCNSGLGKQYIFGYTPNYLRVATEPGKPEFLTNRILPTRLKRIEKENVYVELSL